MVVITAWWELVGHYLGRDFFDLWDNTALGHEGEGKTIGHDGVAPGTGLCTEINTKRRFLRLWC